MKLFKPVGPKKLVFNLRAHVLGKLCRIDPVCTFRKSPSMLPLMEACVEVHGGSKSLVRRTGCPGAVRNRDGRHPSGRNAYGEWMPVVEHMVGLTKKTTGGAPVTHKAHRRTREVSVVSSIRRNGKQTIEIARRRVWHTRGETAWDTPLSRNKAPNK